MRKKHFPITVGLIAMLLIGCNTLPIKSTVEPTTEPIETKVCTLLGCASTIQVSVSGQLPENYSFEFSDTAQTRISTTCVLENYNPRAKVYYTGVLYASEFTRGWPSKTIPNFRTCDNSSYYSVWYHVLGYPISVNKQCTGQPNYDFLHYSRCVRAGKIIDIIEWDISESLDNGIVLSGFSPAEFEITFSTETMSKTTLIQPKYRVRQPNGPDCEPTCKYADVEIEIP